MRYQSWLQYSKEKDAAFCLFYYLFKPHNEETDGDSFTTEGFTTSKMIENFEIHNEWPNGAHNKAREKTEIRLRRNKHPNITIKGIRLHSNVQPVRIPQLKLFNIFQDRGWPFAETTNHVIFKINITSLNFCEFYQIILMRLKV